MSTCGRRPHTVCAFCRAGSRRPVPPRLASTPPSCPRRTCPCSAPLAQSTSLPLDHLPSPLTQSTTSLSFIHFYIQPALTLRHRYSLNGKQSSLCSVWVCGIRISPLELCLPLMTTLSRWLWFSRFLAKVPTGFPQALVTITQALGSGR